MADATAFGLAGVSRLPHDRGFQLRASKMLESRLEAHELQAAEIVASAVCSQARANSWRGFFQFAHKPVSLVKCSRSEWAVRIPTKVACRLFTVTSVYFAVCIYGQHLSPTLGYVHP